MAEPTEGSTEPFERGQGSFGLDCDDDGNERGLDKRREAHICREADQGSYVSDLQPGGRAKTDGYLEMTVRSVLGVAPLPLALHSALVAGGARWNYVLVSGCVVSSVPVLRVSGD